MTSAKGKGAREKEKDKEWHADGSSRSPLMDVVRRCAHARDPIRRPEPTNPSRRRVSTVNAVAAYRGKLET